MEREQHLTLQMISDLLDAKLAPIKSDLLIIKEDLRANKKSMDDIDNSLQDIINQPPIM